MDEIEKLADDLQDYADGLGAAPIIVHDRVELCSLLTRAVAALRSAQVPQWQPIETGPRDGTPILGLWMPSPGAYTTVSGKNYGITAFDEDAGFWALVDDGDEPDEVMRPDFWMPLPAAPSAEGE